MTIYAKKGFFGVLFILIVGCGPSIDPDKQVVGLATPIQLRFEETTLVLEDYFMEPGDIDVFTIPEGLTSERPHPDTLILRGRLTRPADVMTAALNSGVRIDLLLKRSESQEITFTFDPEGKSYGTVQVKGEMNNWNPTATPLELENGVWTASMLVNEGAYQYLFVVDGMEMQDPSNDEKISNGMGGFNNVIRVGDAEKQLPEIQTQSVEGNYLTISEVYATEVIAFWENTHLKGIPKEGEITFLIPEEGIAKDRSHIRVWAYNDVGMSNDLLIPLDSGRVIMDTEELTRHDYPSWNMYFVLIDRFLDGNPDNTRKVDDPSIHPKANYYGGDFAGITQKVRDGYFEKIGVNTLWLSPITQNPETAYGLWDKGGVTTTFSGYHGYWPVSSSRTDDRFGTEDEFRELLDVAHEHGMNVILDYVANHVHELHPVYQRHPEWATNLYLPDGRLNTELWDEQRLTTWFDTFMPTLDFSRPEVVETMTDSALYWVKEFELDGFRHDATKHIQLSFWRTLTRKVKEQVVLPQDRKVFQIGETYGSPPLIASYINSGMLDSQFDFNMYDAAVRTFGQDGSFDLLRENLQQSFAYYGYHNLMGYISGNHDKARLITLTSGEVSWSEDAKLAGWTREIGDPKPFAYDKLNLVHAWNMTIPGIPVTYYGDEFGMPGANDPDSRRWMRFDENELKDIELRNRNVFETLTSVRNSNMPLLYGDFKFHLSEEDVITYSRAYFDQQVLVVMNKSDRSKTIRVDIREGFDYAEAESVFGTEFSILGDQLTITLKPDQFELIIL